MEIASVYDEDGKRDAHSWFGYLMSEDVQSEIFRVAGALDLASRTPTSSTTFPQFTAEAQRRRGR